MNESLIGIGLYTASEAARLTGIPSGKLVRWLQGHALRSIRYERLWKPQVELEDGSVVLSFRDLMEARVADTFIRHGLSPQKVRKAIVLARELVGEERPLSTTRFRTDGKSVFLQVLEEDGQARLIDLFKSQYAFRDVIEPTLKTVEFDNGGVPRAWWPTGRTSGVVVDPQRSFGQPIDADSGVPIDALVAAAASEGSIKDAARLWCVSPESIRRALNFREELTQRQAA